MIRYYLQFLGQPPIDVSRMGVFTLGRNGDIKVLSHSASRIHCMIDVQNYPPLISDGDGVRESKNGTIINGEVYRATAINEHKRSKFLQHNDVIQIGTVEIRFLIFHDEDDSDINATK